ncbi:MAG: phosphotransferase family protein [Burkholderiales bacterium]
MTAGLRRHLLRGREITGLQVLSAGHSNETYLIEGLDMILRLPPSGAPLLEHALDVRCQFDVFAVLGGLPGAPPGPGLYLMEQDAGVLGAPFFLMSRVEGLGWPDLRIPEWAAQGSDALRDTISSEAVGALVFLHQQPPLDVFGPIRSVRQELARWRQTAEGCQVTPLDEAFALLDQTAPADASPAPCHGDPKIANMLWHADGRLVAWLDWELAFNGDPRWDLAYHLGRFRGTHAAGHAGQDQSGFWPRERVVQAWEQATGRSSDRLLWFEAAYKAKVAAILAHGYRLVRQGLSQDARLAQWEAPARLYGETALRMALADQSA